jgi:hypothetical protein
MDRFHSEPRLIRGGEVLFLPSENDQSLTFRKIEEFVDSN